MKWKMKKTIAAILAVILIVGNCSFSYAEDVDLEETIEQINELQEVTEEAHADENVIEQPKEILEDTEELKDIISNNDTPEVGTSENVLEEETVSENEIVQEVNEETEILSQNLIVEKLQVPTLSGIYYGGEEIGWILSKVKEGLNLDDYFQYTIFTGLTEEALMLLNDFGYTLDELADKMLEEEEEVTQEPLLRMMSFSFDVLSSVASTLSVSTSTATLSFGGHITTEPIGTIPAFGTGYHGAINLLLLNGGTAFCVRFGAPAKTGMTYTPINYSALGFSESQVYQMGQVMGWYYSNTVGTSCDYSLAQSALWMIANNTFDASNAARMAANIEPILSITGFSKATVQAMFENLLAYMNGGGACATLSYYSNGSVNQWLVTAKMNFSEDPYESKYIEIKKVDAYTGAVIAFDTTFTLYEWSVPDNAYIESTLSISRDGDVYRSEELMYSIRNLGKFYVVETNAPYGYYGDYSGGVKNTYEVMLEEESDVATIEIPAVFPNTPVKGTIVVNKTDIETNSSSPQGDASMNGAIYDLYAASNIYTSDGNTLAYSSGSLVASSTIENGSLTFDNLYLGNYTVKEKVKEVLADGKKMSYATGYLVDESSYSASISYAGETVSHIYYTVNSNKEQVIKAKAVFDKCESATGQGTINYLEGAGFTIYKINNLSKFSKFTLNSDGTYNEDSIREAYEVENYTNETPKYDFTAEGAAIAKVSVDSDASFYYTDALTDIAAGRLVKVSDRTYKVEQLFSDANGHVITPYFPYGQYIVVETTTPADHFTSKPFVLTFYENRTTKVETVGITTNTTYGINYLKGATQTVGASEAVYYAGLIDNEEIEQLLRIYKKDADTGKDVLLVGTGFKIARISANGTKTYITHTSYYPESVTYNIFYTSSDGYLQLPELLTAGTYQIEEVEGPVGFYNNTSNYVTFKVTTEREYVAIGNTSEGSIVEGENGERDVILIYENYYNSETRGRLVIRKKGEVLTGMEKADIDLDSLEIASAKFLYEVAGIAEAEFLVVASADIVTQDRQVDEKGNRTLWFQKGDVIATVTTGTDGQIDAISNHQIVSVSHNGVEGEVIIDLPLGSYQVYESKAPFGYTVSDIIYDVTFTWNNQYEKIVYADKTDGSITFLNDRVKAVPKDEVKDIGIGIFKTSVETGEPLSGVVFGLYSKEEIYAHDGKLILKAGTLLGVTTTDEEGYGFFPVDVPIRDEDYEQGAVFNSGNYLIQEIYTPSGIYLAPTKMEVSLVYKGQDTEYVVLNATMENKTSFVYIEKRATTKLLTTETEESVSNNRIEETTETEEETISGNNADVSNSPTDDGGILVGATLQIIDAESGNVIKEFISKDSATGIRALYVNRGIDSTQYAYILREVKAPTGFALAQDIYFKLVAEEENSNSVYVWKYEYKEKIWKWKKMEGVTVVMYDEGACPITITTLSPLISQKKISSIPEPDEPVVELVPPVITPPQTGDTRNIKALCMGLETCSILLVGIGIVTYKRKRWAAK